MRKLLIYMTIGFGVLMFAKSFVTPDSNGRPGGSSAQNQPLGPGSQFISLLAAMLLEQSPPATAANTTPADFAHMGAGLTQPARPAATPSRMAAPLPPPLPTVTTTAGVYVPPASTGSTGGRGGTGSGVAKGADIGPIPPELARFMTPSLLTTTPAGMQELSPAARQALQQIMAQARANPASFKEQYGAAKDQFSTVAKALRGQQ